MVDFASCSQLFQNLSVVDGLTCPFVQTMGYWWVYLIFLVVLGGAYVATKRPEVVAAMSVLGAAVAGTWLPATVQMGIYVVAVFSLAAAIYLWIRGKDNNG